MTTAPTPPDQVRAGLSLVTDAAKRDVQVVATSGGTSEEVRSSLFAATPLIVADYSDGAAALALDWYEELRDAANPERPYAPIPVRAVTDEEVRSIVAVSTVALLGPPDQLETDPVQTSLRLIQGGVQELVANAFRATITDNSVADPAAAGWKRFARPEACKFCKMLAAKGAVYTETTARFAAHGATVNGKRRGGDCMCIAGPEFGGKETWAAATPIQYVASQRYRNSKQRARLREYLNEHFPDAPG